MKFKKISSLLVGLDTSKFSDGLDILNDKSSTVQKAFEDINNKLGIATTDVAGLMSTNYLIDLNNLKSIIKPIKDTSSNWSDNNPVISEGQVCIDTDTNIYKIGNGTDKYLDIPNMNIGINNSGAAKGDMVVFNGSIWLKVPKGADGQVLNVDSDSDSGVAWKDNAIS